MQKHQIISVTAVALLALAACGTESASDPGSSSGTGSGPGPGAEAGPEDSGGSVQTDLPFIDVRWNVSGVSVDGRKTPVPAGAGVEIRKDGQISLSTGCNGYGGNVKVDGDTITVGRKASTAMGCEDHLMAFEGAMGKAFSGKLKATMASDDKGLTLTSADGKKNSISLTSDPSVLLTGSKWQIAPEPSGHPADSPPPGPQPGKAYFSFFKDGTVRGNLGCNSFSGSAKVTASTITFGPLTSTRKMCPAADMAVEHRTQKALTGKATYELGGGHSAQLTLKSADGTTVLAHVSG
jgi:heat shock protein HslJ